MRTITHYLAALALLTIYGGAVCPFVELLPLTTWALTLAGAFAPLALARWLLLPRVVEMAPLHSRPGRQFLLEFALFILFGLVLCVYNVIVYQFPVVESGLKIITGFIVFGFFIGLDLALEREYLTGKTIVKQNIAVPKADRYTSMTRKFASFALATVALVGVVIILVVVKDVYWLTEIDYWEEGTRAELLIFMEIGFILAILCAYVLTIIISYTRNIRFFFGNETTILRRVSEGDLSGRVPNLSRDEFGEIASHTNTMIEGLEERDRIKSVFGKAVSPTIANRLMEQAGDGTPLGGSSQFLVILFSDIRGFTSRTESGDPQALISDLNAWFTQAVESIDAHGGVVDKFIGDGILAVFGLDGDPDACRKAVDCARDMHTRLDTLNPALSTPMSVGIGIHKGEVVAGIVGSPERLEFTVIGDVVNTASRIESMTRPLEAAVLVSEAVYADLDNDMDLTRWQDFGEQQLKGKSQSMRLFGLPVHK